MFVAGVEKIAEELEERKEPIQTEKLIKSVRHDHIEGRNFYVEFIFVYCSLHHISTYHFADLSIQIAS